MFSWGFQRQRLLAIDGLTGKTGLAKKLMGNLRQAWFGEHSSRLIAVRDDSSPATRPKRFKVCIGRWAKQAFGQDYNIRRVRRAERRRRHGVPRFPPHSGPVRINRRDTILPPYLFRQHDAWSGRSRAEIGAPCRSSDRSERFARARHCVHGTNGIDLPLAPELDHKYPKQGTGEIRNPTDETLDEQSEAEEILPKEADKIRRGGRTA